MKTYTVDSKKQGQIDAAFTYWPPREDQPPRYLKLRAETKMLADLFVTLTPPSREQSLALTKLEEALMWANAAIARNE